MFNEILTGKASLEPEPAAAGPYREQGALPPVHHACTVCRQTYEAPAGSAPGRCPTCHVAMVQENAAHSALALHQAQEHQRRAERSHRILRGCLIAAVALGLGVFRYGMRKQQREDAAQAAGYHSYREYETERDAVYPTDSYSSQIHDFATTMCACQDLACSRTVMAQFTRFARSGAPTDDQARASVEQDSDRITTCAAMLENQRP